MSRLVDVGCSNRAVAVELVRSQSGRVSCMQKGLSRGARRNPLALGRGLPAIQHAAATCAPSLLAVRKGERHRSARGASSNLRWAFGLAAVYNASMEADIRGARIYQFPKQCLRNWLRDKHPRIPICYRLFGSTATAAIAVIAKLAQG